MTKKARLKAVTWSPATFEALETALAEAPPGRPDITVDFGRKFGKIAFTWDEATEALSKVATDFAMHPLPVFPENREGQEP